MSPTPTHQGLIREGRGVGNTTRQMLAAPKGAVFIWTNSMLTYPKLLARHLRRDDLQIVSPDWLRDRRFAGLLFSAVVVDHATLMIESEWRGLQEAYARARGALTASSRKHGKKPPLGAS